MSGTDITDTDADYFLTRCTSITPVTVIAKFSEAKLPPAERRGCNLAIGRAAYVRRALAKTDVHPVVIAPYNKSLSECLIRSANRRARREFIVGASWCVFAAIVLFAVLLDVPYLLGCLSAWLTPPY